MRKPKIYIATVALERNRWGSKVPSFAVSEWLERFKADGFDGVELWENHYLSADAEEKSRLEAAAPIAILNSYTGFDDGAAEQRERSAVAAGLLKAEGVKFNFGNMIDRIDEYRRNLLTWADALPDSCELLCECHGGTVLETIEPCQSVFSGLESRRFGMMIHMSGNADAAKPWFDAFGERIRHVHIQLRKAESDPATEQGRAALYQGIAALRAFGFAGNMSLEFTRGIGKDEDIELLYANACSDMRAVRQLLESVEAGKSGD